MCAEAHAPGCARGTEARRHVPRDVRGGTEEPRCARGGQPRWTSHGGECTEATIAAILDLAKAFAR
eukprot:8146192-Pyramimonas_sp.AAC.1